MIYTNRNRAFVDGFLCFGFVCVDVQVALKRQQAVEDAIALRLASNETGKSIDSLPPGKIYGMTITEPCEDPQPKEKIVQKETIKNGKIRISLIQI